MKTNLTNTNVSCRERLAAPRELESLGMPIIATKELVKICIAHQKTVFLIHGTWSADLSEWRNIDGIYAATYAAFGAKREVGDEFWWTGGNCRDHRTEAAHKLIREIRKERARVSASVRVPITLVGHSHGGNVAIQAINLMVDRYKDEFRHIRMNLLTLNTPVRLDYRLKPEARRRTKHIHVFNRRDIVQIMGNGWFLFSPDKVDKRGPHGEFGLARRRFRHAQNIKDARDKFNLSERFDLRNLRQLFSDLKDHIYSQHQSNNHVCNWIDDLHELFNR